MKLWSRGLGTTEVDMDFEKYQAIEENENVIVIGNMISPVNWEFKITMTPQDIVGFARLFFSWPVFKYTLKNSWRILKYIFQKKTPHDPDAINKINSAYKTMFDRASRRKR